MTHKSKTLKDFSVLLKDKLGQKQTQAVMSQAFTHFDQLVNDHPGEPKALRQHTVGSIYPAIALYRGLQDCGMAKKEALALLDQLCSLNALPQARMIRGMLKIPGLYRAMPGIFRWMTVHKFGEAAGFQARFYPTDKKRCKFDMTKCAYYQVCLENHCPEIVPCFCHTDDVTNGNMHRKLIWHRTKTIGEGADLCDFEIYIQD